MCTSENYLLESQTLFSKIKKQMSNTVQTRVYRSQLETTSSAFRGLFIAGLVFNLLLTDSMMVYMMFMIRAL